MGTRALLMQAGLPPPYWACAVTYFCLCYNARTPEEGKISWERRFGHPFEAPLLPFESLVRSPARIEISDGQDWRNNDSGVIPRICAQSGG
eukprot:237637-Pyramimonas_sp.AAC.1